MKRYEGSEIIGYRGPKFDEYLVPLGPPTSQDPPAYKKSVPLEGQVSYYDVPGAGRPDADGTFPQPYKLEFQRLSLETLLREGRRAARLVWSHVTTKNSQGKRHRPDHFL